MIESLRYKLRWFAIPVEGPADICCDNMSVVNNLSIPTSALINKKNSISCYRLKGAQDAGIIQVGWNLGEFNLAELFTKTTMNGNTWHN